MKSLTNYHPNLLKALTYELVNGQPVLYRGHQAVSRGQKSVRELYARSPQQRRILSELCFDLHADFGEEYFILSSPQLRLAIDENNWRSIEVAIVRKNTRKAMDSTVITQAPEYVFLVDTKASLLDLRHPFSYYHQKANDLLEFGVQKVVWLFTQKQQLMVASASRKRWPLQDWDQPVWLEPDLRWDCPLSAVR